MTQTIRPAWETIAPLNNQSQVWAYPFDTRNVPEDKNVFMVQRDRGCRTTIVIGDVVSIHRPADKDGQQAFSVGIYKEQLTAHGKLTPTGAEYSKAWGVHARNTYGMIQWALSYNHDRTQPSVNYNGPANT